MSVATDSPEILSEGVLVRSYIAHTDGLKDAAPMRAGECRPHSCVAGMATGLKLIGPDRGNYRDWVLEGFFLMTDAATGGRTQASRMFNRDRKFFMTVRDLLKTGKTVEFGYVFYVERLPGFGGLKGCLKIIELSVEGSENSPSCD